MIAYLAFGGFVAIREVDVVRVGFLLASLAVFFLYAFRDLERAQKRGRRLRRLPRR
ncbi:MAG TPA: hypothetical protein VLD39_00730 [Gammaproteobacteria bacterium]|nr:hypothetical protein [Gammaproteobacteria bacterium]